MVGITLWELLCAMAAFMALGFALGWWSRGELAGSDGVDRAKVDRDAIRYRARRIDATRIFPTAHGGAFTHADAVAVYNAQSDDLALQYRKEIQ